MNKDLIKKNYLIKIKSIQKLNRFYYDESKPILSDADYALFTTLSKAKFINFNVSSNEKPMISSFK